MGLPFSIQEVSHPWMLRVGFGACVATSIFSSFPPDIRSNTITSLLCLLFHHAVPAVEFALAIAGAIPGNAMDKRTSAPYLTLTGVLLSVEISNRVITRMPSLICHAWSCNARVLPPFAPPFFKCPRVPRAPSLMPRVLCRHLFDV